MTEASDQGRVRASDGEREEYAQFVRTAMSEGRLTLDEGEQRLTRVYAVRFRDELPPLIEDLPIGDWPSRADPEGSADGSDGRRDGFRGRIRQHFAECGAAAMPAVVVFLVVAAIVGPFYLFGRVFPLAFVLLTLLFLRRIVLGRRRHWLHHQHAYARAGGFAPHWGPCGSWAGYGSWAGHGPWAEHGPHAERGPWVGHGPHAEHGPHAGHGPSAEHGASAEHGPWRQHHEGPHGQRPTGGGWHR